MEKTENEYTCILLWQTPAISCYEIISDEDMITNLFYQYVDLYPEIRNNVLDIDLTNPNILRVVDYINQNYHMQISNTALASIADYSLNYFITFDSGFPTAHRSSKKLSQK